MTVEWYYFNDPDNSLIYESVEFYLIDHPGVILIKNGMIVGYENSVRLIDFDRKTTSHISSRHIKMIRGTPADWNQYLDFREKVRDEQRAEAKVRQKLRENLKKSLEKKK